MSYPTVVVLSGGENTRFFPLNHSLNKAAVPICGEALLLRTLKSLESAGATKVVIVTPPLDKAGKSLQQLPGMTELSLELHFVIQSEAKGMGDAVLRCREFLNEQFAVIAPYTIRAGETISQLLELGTTAAVCATTTTTPWRYGMLTIKDGLATGIIEKPTRGNEPSNKKLRALYLLNQRFLTILESLPEDHYSFETAANQLMGEQAVGVLEFETPPPSLKYAWHLFDFQTEIFSQLESNTDPLATIAPTAVIDDSAGPVVIEAGAKINHAARIVGPTYIGRNALVGDFSLIRSSSLESNAQVGAYTEVVRSILLPGVHIHAGYLADSIIGADSKIGAGLITANKRLDRKSVAVTIKGEEVDSGRTNLGVLMGEHVTVGIRTNVMPGICIGANSVIYPNHTLTQTIEQGEVVRN